MKTPLGVGFEYTDGKTWIRAMRAPTEKNGVLRGIPLQVAGSSPALGTNNIVCVRKISIIL